MTMAHIGGINATFTNTNIKSGKTMLTFELAQSDAALLPDLAKITGQPVTLEVSTAQQELMYADAEPIADDPAPTAVPTLALGA